MESEPRVRRSRAFLRDRVIAKIMRLVSASDSLVLGHWWPLIA